MIEIKYSKSIGKRTVVVSGHAGSAPEGHDLVCAAVSTLLISLGSIVSDLDNADKLRSGTVCLDKGAGCVSAIPKLRGRKKCWAAFDVVCCGMKYLADSFPEYVKWLEEP